MTESTEDEYMTMMNAFTDTLHARLAKLTARPTRQALRNMLFVSMLDTGLTLVPDHHDYEPEDDIDDDPTGDGDTDDDTLHRRLDSWERCARDAYASMLIIAMEAAERHEFDTAQDAQAAASRALDVLDRINGMRLRLDPDKETE